MCPHALFREVASDGVLVCLECRKTMLLCFKVPGVYCVFGSTCFKKIISSKSFEMQ